MLVLGLTSILSLHIGLEHGLHKGHKGHTLIVGLLGLRELTCCYHKGLTVALIATAVYGVVGLVGAAVGFATLANFLTVSLLLDLITQAPRCFPFGITLGIRMGCSSLTLCLELFILLLNHDPLNSLYVR
jgi:hypothetical protein